MVNLRNLLIYKGNMFYKQQEKACAKAALADKCAELGFVRRPEASQGASTAGSLNRMICQSGGVRCP